VVFELKKGILYRQAVTQVADSRRQTLRRDSITSSPGFARLRPESYHSLWGDDTCLCISTASPGETEGVRNIMVSPCFLDGRGELATQTSEPRPPAGGPGIPNVQVDGSGHRSTILCRSAPESP
jgi:hypothetical protein